MEVNNLFIYQWHIDDKEKEVTSIRIYGLDENNNNVCLRVENFTPFVYIELPQGIKWDVTKAQILCEKLDNLLGEQKPIIKQLSYRKKLYGAHFNSNGTQKIFPYLFCAFSNRNDIFQLGYKIRRAINISGLGVIKLKIHEQSADPILQLTCSRDIPTTGWITFSGKLVKDDDKVTLCHREFIVKYKFLSKLERNIVALPKILGFDIEVNSSNPSAMPKSENIGDKVFQISCVISREGSGEYTSYLLSLGDPHQEITGNDVIIQRFQTEADLLCGFTDLIRSENPNIIVGYNILGFDIPYMIERAKLHMCITNFDLQGFHKYLHAKEKTIKWTSSAYGTQEFQFLDSEGRLYIDLLPLVKRDFKMDNYKLKTISDYFLGETKDPLSVKGIFKCYRIGISKNMNGQYSQKARKAMAIVGKYCVQDSILVIKLMKKLQTWIGLCEMSKTCNVPIFTLYTQGQQIKVYSQIYKYCMYNNITVEQDVYETKDDDRYTGAHVFDPIPGVYDRVLPFDFASLYPTTIIAYNIDYSTIVDENSDIPDELCHIMEWEDHIFCIHDPKVIRKTQLTSVIDKEKEKIKNLRNKRDKTLDKLIKKEINEQISIINNQLKPYIQERSNIYKSKPKFSMCAKRKYRFLKNNKGILPTILQNLLDARSHTRKEIKINKQEIQRLQSLQDENFEDKISNLIMLNNVLDKRQLAYKVSANSMYGAMGVKKGYLPFMPGAMCTTYMGRKSIELVAKIIPEKYGGQLIYGDTDSNYIHFPHLQTAEESWDYAEKVANEVSNLFPKPMKLEFEEIIYWRFFILTKKRYMYTSCGRDGVISNKIGKKGVLLARRDNSIFIKKLYEKLIIKIFDRETMNNILYFIIEEINKLCSNGFNYKDFSLTKAIGSVNNMTIEYFENEKGEKKGKIGDYTVPYLSNEEDKRNKQFNLKKVTNEQEYYLKCLPAQVQLAEKMKKRGQRVSTGTRLEYVITENGGHKGKQYEKIENTEYFSAHRDILKIDFMYYLKLFVNPADQVLLSAYKDEIGFTRNFVLKQYNYRLLRIKMLNELKDIFKPILIFEK